MKELHVHFGAHKTASTSIQNFLEEQGENAEWRYISLQDMKSKPWSLLHGVCRRSFRAETPRRYAKKIARAVEALPQNNVIISNENLLGQMPGLESSFYPNIPNLVTFLEELKRHFKLKGLIFVREQGSYIKSCYQFRVAKGLGEPIENFTARIIKEGISWLGVVEQLDNVLEGNLTVLPYELWKRNQKRTIIELRRFHTAFNRLRGLPKSNVSAPEFPMFILQRARAHGVRSDVLTRKFSVYADRDIRKLCGTRRWWELDPPPYDRIEEILCRHIEDIYSPWRRSWRRVVAEAIKEYAQRALEGSPPHDLDSKTRELIKRKYREENTTLFNRHIRKKWIFLWD